MRSAFFVLFLSLTIGSLCGLGVAYSVTDTGQPHYAFNKPLARRNSADTSASPDQTRPQAVILGDTTFDFGIMSRNESRKHTFVVENRGTANLNVRFTDKTCQCTDVFMSRTDIPPGESADIVLTWQPSSFNPKFEQSARFTTNDPGRLELDLTVKGKVQQVVQVTPRALNIENLQADTEREAICQLFAYQSADVKIEELKLLDQDTAEFFDVQIEPMPTEILAAETGAVAGQQIRVTVKPGLPIGPFQQRLQIRLNKPQLGVRELPILGSVTGSIGIVGPQYSRTTNTWELGMLSGGEVHQRRLWFLVRGNPPDSVELKVKSVDPTNVLEATILPPQNPGLAKYTLELQIRPDGKVVSRLGNQRGKLGEIVVETTLPDSPEIRIPVAFGIESNQEP